MISEKLTPQVRKLALADRAFEQCLELISYMKAHFGEIQLETVGFCMISGICVTYCKNFIESDGIGKLPNLYSTFDDEKLRQCHQDLMESRDAIYAHRDLMRDGALRKGELNPELLWVQITFFEHGGMAINTQENHIHPERLTEIEMLIEFQRNRLKYDLSDKIMALADGKKYLPAEYILGETFP